MRSTRSVLVRALVAAGVTATCVVAAAPHADAATIHVGPGQSIQAAVNAASPGDTITLSPTTYQEKVTVTKDHLTIVGNGAVLTQVPSSNAQWGVCVSAFPTCLNVSAGHTVTGVLITGLTVTGIPAGGGISVIGATNTVLRADTVRNSLHGFLDDSSVGTSMSADTATGNELNGFWSLGSRNATVTNVRAVGNGGYGVLALFASDLLVTASVSKQNCAGMVVSELGATPGSVTASYNQFEANNASCPEQIDIAPPLDGVGALVLDATHVTFTHNSFQSNGQGSFFNFSGGLFSESSVPNAGNVFSANALSANSPLDIGTDDATPSTNLFQGNACHVSDPAGPC